MKALNLALVTNGEGTARLVGTLLNTGEVRDRLVRADVDTGLQEFDVVIADEPVVLPPEDPFALARDASMTVFTERLRPGFRAELTLVFERSRPIVTTVPVERPVGPYAEVEVTSPPDGDIAPD